MKLYRSQRDRKLFGLCGGLAQTLNVDATLLRLVLVVTAFFSAGTTIMLYFLACLVIPKEPMDDMYGPGSWHGRQYSHPPKYKEEMMKPDIDEMMKEVEQKKMQMELEKLRAKVAEYEKGER